MKYLLNYIVILYHFGLMKYSHNLSFPQVAVQRIKIDFKKVKCYIKLLWRFKNENVIIIYFTGICKLCLCKL